MRRMRARGVAGLASLLVLAAGCGGGSGSTSGPGTSGPAFGTQEFGLSDAELDARIQDVENSISSCLTAAGFEYVPVDPATIRDAMDADGTKPGVSDADYVAQYGFGITTVFEDPVADLGRGEQNTTIVAALAPADRAAYDQTLLGEPGAVGLARALEDEDLSNTGGCTRAALAASFAKDELADSYTNPADVLLEEDPRMVAAIGSWSQCVHDAGYDYAHPDDITDELAQRLEALLGGADPTTLAGPEQAALADLQAEERAVAVVASDCEEQHIVPVQDTIEAEIYGAPPS